MEHEWSTSGARVEHERRPPQVRQPAPGPRRQCQWVAQRGKDSVAGARRGAEVAPRARRDARSSCAACVPLSSPRRTSPARGTARWPWSPARSA
eukprot:651638-Prymnesium_polylepis.1